jgi:uncharacterized protein YaiI (UPF0178 family)
MNISEEIKRMMSLLESEMGNVKPLINEDDEPVTEVNGPKDILKRAINTGCWTKKGYTYSDGTPITTYFEEKISKVNDNYLYALNKIDPNIKVGDPFVKLKANGIDVYMFGTITTNPQYPGAYLAVVKNINAPKQTTANPNPNQNYLESHGWECAEFKETQNLTSQSVNMTADQTNAVNILAGTDYVKRSRGRIYTTKPLGDDVNYQTIDLATGKNTKGEQVIPAQDMELISGYKFAPGKFFVYLVVGTQTKYTDMPVAVEQFIQKLGYTAQEPSDMGSTEAQNPTNVTELCNTIMVGQCNATILKYAENNGGQTLWPMNDTQKAEAGVTVFNQADLEAGFTANKRMLRKNTKEFNSKFADKRSCQTGIDILSMCSKFNDDKRCEGYMNQLVSSGAITFPKGMETYSLKIAGLKQLVGQDCMAVDVKIPNKYEPMLAQLQSSTGKFGLVAPTVKTDQGTINPRGGNLEESLNKSIKSVISETINKNNNKNLDSIIKKNLRKYIR